MPDGTALIIGQVIPPSSSATALTVVPSGRLYNPTGGVPAASPNASILNDSLSLSGATMSREAYPSDNAAVRAFDKIAGTTLAQSARTQALQRQSAAQAASGVTATQQMVADTHSAITNVQSTIDSNQLLNSQLFGFQSGPNATQEIWNYNDSATWFNPVENHLVNASVGGAIIMSQMMIRLFTSVNFLMLYNFAFSSQGFPDVENLNAARPQAKTREESVLDYLLTTLPQYSWQEDHQGTGLVGMDFQSLGDGITRSYFWSPPPPTLDDIYHLWDYTPSSGPPSRNGIEDLLQFLALVPIQWSTFG